jgi:hypothetical protein
MQQRKELGQVHEALGFEPFGGSELFPSVLAIEQVL